MADRFFTPHPVTVGEFALDGPEAHHLTHVKRAAIGDRITLFNGDGTVYDAEIIGVGKKVVTLEVKARREVCRERAHALIIAAAMPKGDRGDFMIEKLTELGATRFVPLITERTVVVPKAARLESLRRTVIEASKQCGRNVLMVIEEPVKWNAFAVRVELPATKLILHPNDSVAFSSPTSEAVIAIGPEGGFTDDELNVPGWSRVSMGPRILRIETAAIAACV